MPLLYIKTAVGFQEGQKALFPMLCIPENEWWGPEQNQGNPCWVFDQCKKLQELVDPS